MCGVAASWRHFLQSTLTEDVIGSGTPDSAIVWRRSGFGAGVVAAGLSPHCSRANSVTIFLQQSAGNASPHSLDSAPRLG